MLIECPNAKAHIDRHGPMNRRSVGRADANAISTGDLLYKTHYPAQTSGQTLVHRTALQSYNALGEVIRSTDPAGNRIDTTYSTAGRVVLREVQTFGSGFDTAVKSIETSYDGMGRLSRARSLSSTSATLNDEVFAYDGWGNLSQTTVDADSAYDASSGTPPMVTTMTWTRNTTASGWQRLRQATVEQPGGASARYKVDGDTISQAMGRISHIQENLTGSGAVLADYRYMGASAAVAAVLPEASIGTRLYYFNGGSAQYDEYMDRFNRVLKNQWQKVNSSTNAPVFVEFKPEYDRSGLVTSVEDTIFGSGLKDGDTNPDFTRTFDQLITRDALKRVTKQEEGHLNSGRTAILTGKMSRQQILERDLRGRVTTNKVDLNGDNDFADGPLGSADGGEMNDTRSFFHAQTLLTRSVIDKDRPGTAVTPVYDRNGNLASDGEKHVYRYNPWCQLVEVQAYGVWPIKVLAKYSYTATGQRVTEVYDNSGDGAVTSADVMTIIASDTSGRRVASFVDHGDFFAKETFFHHPPHIRGPGFAGGPIVRDRNEDLVDPNQWKRAASEERLERRYYATDWQGRVVSLVTAAGAKAEDYRYSATGVPFGIPLGDINADGKVDGGTTGADYTLAFDQQDSGVYDARVDLNLDGALTQLDDVAIVAGQDGVATGRGELSARSVASAFIKHRTEWAELVGLAVHGKPRYSASLMLFTRRICTDDFPWDEHLQQWFDDTWIRALRSTVPDAVDLPITVLEVGPGIFAISVCKAFREYEERRQAENPRHRFELDPEYWWLKMFCDAANSRTKIRNVCCAPYAPDFVGPIPAPGDTILVTQCPKAVDDQSCCDLAAASRPVPRKRHQPVMCSLCHPAFGMNCIPSRWGDPRSLPGSPRFPPGL